MDKFYTTEEVAELLRLHRNTIIRLIQRRELGASVFGSHYRITETQLNEYLQRQTIQVKDKE